MIFLLFVAFPFLSFYRCFCKENMLFREPLEKEPEKCINQLFIFFVLLWIKKKKNL